MDSLEPRGEHGVLLREAMDPMLQDKWDAEPVTDFALQKLRSVQKFWHDNYAGRIDLDSQRWRVFRKD